MSLAHTRSLIREYITKTRIAYLAIIRADGIPTIRPIGSFAPVGGDSLDVWFVTPRDSEKFRALVARPLVSFFFDHEAQDFAAHQAVSLLGSAAEVAPGSQEYEQACEALVARSPHFRGMREKGALDTAAIVRVSACETHYSNRATGGGIQVIKEA